MSMPSSSQSSAPHVVIVDSDVAIRNALTFALEMDGFTVESHPGGEALLQQCAWPARTCLIIGHELSGLNGLELLQALRMRKVTAAAVLTMTNPTRRHRAEAAAAGVPIVEKPLLSEELEKAVHDAIEAADEPHAKLALAS
jgi:FixJ family two-component response regulator